MTETLRIALIALGEGAAERMSSLASLDIQVYCEGAAEDLGNGVRPVDLAGLSDEDIVAIVSGTDMTIVVAMDSGQEAKVSRLGTLARKAEVPFTLLAAGKDTFEGSAVINLFRGIIVLDAEDVGGLLAKVLDVFIFPSLINLDLADLRTVLGYGREALASMTEFHHCGGDGLATVGPSPVTTLDPVAGSPPTAVAMRAPHDAALVHIIGGARMTVSEMDEICRDVCRRFGPRHMIMGVRIRDDELAEPSVLSIVTRSRAA